MLLHTDAAGGVQTVNGTAYIDVGRDGARTLTGIVLADALVLEVDSTLESAATGWAVGTEIEVDRIRIRELRLVLDGRGVGRVPAVGVAFDLTVFEPGSAAVAETLFAGLPALTVTAANRRFAVARWSDGVGGTFEVR